MSGVEVAYVTVHVIGALIGIAYVIYVVRTAGCRPERRSDPEPERGTKEWREWLTRRLSEPGPGEEEYYASLRDDQEKLR